MSSQLLLALKSWPRTGKWSLPRNVGGKLSSAMSICQSGLGVQCRWEDARRKVGAWEVRGLKGGTEGQGPSLWAGATTGAKVPHAGITYGTDSEYRSP